MNEILINVVANLIATLILALIGFIVYSFLYWKNRNRILRFFGITSSNSNICIYVSNLNIRPGGTSGIENIDEGYSGSAITKLEYDGALLIQDELKGKPLALFSKRIQDRLGQKNLELKAIDAPIKLSPTEQIDKIDSNENSIFKSHLIILGTGIYNSLSHYYLNDYFPKHDDIYRLYFYHAKDNKGQRVIGTHQNGLADSITEKGREQRVEPAFIQRFYDVDKKISVFICAGLGSSATFGSCHYLIENWRSLQRKFGNEDFGIGLLFPNQDPDGKLAEQEQPELFCDNLLRRSKPFRRKNVALQQ